MAAGAAAAGLSVVGCALSLGAVFDLERVAAPARGGGVRVVDLEPGLLQAGEEVDRGSLEIRSAEGIDDDVDALDHELVIALHRLGVEPEVVLKPGTAPALDRHA